jgi:lipopolysaccharide transport system permease protein
MTYVRLSGAQIRSEAALPKLPITIIERVDQTKFDILIDLWKYHELLSCLVWREIQVRYRQTVLGAAWAIVQPLSLMIVFTLFVHRVAGGPTSEVPYSLFVLTGLVPWTFFGGAVTSAGQSIVRQQHLITKIFFPRLILPMSAIGMALADFAIALVIVPFLMIYHAVFPGWGFWVFPIALLGLTAAALGVGALLASLTVAYRDFQFVIPFMIQVWMFATPGIYLQANSSPLGSRWQPLLALNPAQGLIVNFRAALLNLQPDYLSLGISLTISFGLLLVGCVFFHRQERYFADIV